MSSWCNCDGGTCNKNLSRDVFYFTLPLPLHTHTHTFLTTAPPVDIGQKKGWHWHWSWSGRVVSRSLIADSLNLFSLNRQPWKYTCGCAFIRPAGENWNKSILVFPSLAQVFITIATSPASSQNSFYHPWCCRYNSIYNASSIGGASMISVLAEKMLTM